MKFNLKYGAYNPYTQRFEAGFDSLHAAKQYVARCFVPDANDCIVLVSSDDKVLEPYVKEENRIRFETACHFNSFWYVSFKPTNEYDEEILNNENGGFEGD